MNIYHNTNQHLHHPRDEYFNAQRINNPEIPERVENILSALHQESDLHQLIEVQEVDPNHEQSIREHLSIIHDPVYLKWLETTQVEEATYPSVFNHQQAQPDRGSLPVQWGNFVTDTFTPLLPQTWNVALTATESVYRAYQHTLATGAPSFCLTRPPGHHAGRSRVGGYCFLNNAALAAQLFSEHGTVATLDVDYHHGNGTQDIFYQRSDVFTCSIHADPQRKFPYFLGMEEEVGIDAGEGANRNYPLAAGISNQHYQQTLTVAVNWIAVQQPSFLVVSLGLDTHQSDPICDFELTTAYYQQMATTISELNLPTVIVLEGGYSTGAIGANVVSFLQGFENK